MKSIVLDVDNTICEKKEMKEYAELKPYPEMIDMIKAYRKKGYYIILNTARQMNTYQHNLGKINKNTLPQLINWLDKWEIPYDEIYVGKPWCGTEGFYVDDRAIRPSEFLEMSEGEILKKIEAEPWR
ncbi:capsular biosynthesis protein [Enterococcus alishanensis]